MLRTGQGASAASGLGAVLLVEEAVFDVAPPDAPAGSLVRIAPTRPRASTRRTRGVPVVAADQADGRSRPETP